MTDLVSAARRRESGDAVELNVLGISGSLRRGSFNSALLAAARDLAPEGIRITEYGGLRELPPYDADHDTETPPDPVQQLRTAIASADALLIATPEYNYSIPGVLKNAIDWASRPAATSVLRHKPVALMGAAPGNFGTVRAQLALRQMLVWTESIPVVKPELHVFSAAARFDESGKLIDEETQQILVDLLYALRDTATARAHHLRNKLQVHSG